MEYKTLLISMRQFKYYLRHRAWNLGKKWKEKLFNGTRVRAVFGYLRKSFQQSISMLTFLVLFLYLIGCAFKRGYMMKSIYKSKITVNAVKLKEKK